MPIHKLKLLERIAVTNNTLLLKFEKPVGFNFIPGQYGGFTLINSPINNPQATTRRFSLLSSPEENIIAIATRMQDTPYKQALNDLELGQEIKFAGPTGNFILHKDTSIPAVFIAGGIGITPFYCMLKHAVMQNSQQIFYLFYGNQSIADAAFLDELMSWQNKLSHFKLIPTLANPDPTWAGETGYITHTLIKKYIPDLSQPVYYVCGSPAMVNALRETLKELDIHDEKINIEDFPGY